MFMYEFNEEEYREVIKEEAREAGLAEGRAEGRTEGIAAAKAENARRMLADGLNTEKVALYSGLSIEEVHALAHGEKQ